ncbi:MAG: hypothetical protein H6Q67_783 [Firmicutes bacterium]|nr:hypothetical protein [Bacillota bacterium]
MVGVYFPIASFGFQVLCLVFVIGVLGFLYRISNSLQRLADHKENNDNH